MERRTQAARRQAAREQITQAALTVFSLKGYAAATMDDICLAAGCSKGGLYHHFRTKPEVLTSVVARLGERGQLRPPAHAHDGHEALGRVLLDIWAEASRDAAIRGQLSDAGGDGPGLGYLLRIGTLVQALTRGDETDAAAVAARLGIDKAA